MKQKNLYLSIIAIVFIFAFGVTLVLTNITCAIENKTTTSTKTQVIKNNGKPYLTLNGKKFDSQLIEIYYYPDDIHSNQPVYGSGTRWLTVMKNRIDLAKSLGIKNVVVPIWWSDLDKSTSRPTDLSKSLDFKNFDSLMEYSSTKGVYITIANLGQHFIPNRWLQENKFPISTKKGWYDRSTMIDSNLCDECETDSYGISYKNVSYGADNFRKDYTKYLKVVIERYKNNKALMGWLLGVGPTGEDNYGPNYLYFLKSTGYETVGEIKGTTNNPRITDFSTSFIKKYKSWLKNKYKTNSALQKAWNDTTISFEDFKMPKSQDLLITNEGAKTQKAKDYDDFKNIIRHADIQYYTSLFKKYDPNHILLYGSPSADKYVLKHKNIDGILFNPTLNWLGNGWGDNMQFYTNMQYISTITKEGKLAIPASENGQHINGESKEQLNYVSGYGKATKCFNGIMGFNMDVLDQDISSNSWLPTWFTKQILGEVRKIVNYISTTNCKCEIVKEVYNNNKCSNPTKDNENGCMLINKAYGEYCGVKTNTNNYNNINTDNKQNQNDNSKTKTQENNNDSQEMIGVIGCSLTVNSLNGYETLGGSKIWKVSDISNYPGGSVNNWIADMNSSDGGRWKTFEQLLKKYPNTKKIWWEMCSSLDVNKITIDDINKIVTKINTLSDGLEIYVSNSPVRNGYTCNLESTDGVSILSGYIDTLVSKGKVKKGPLMTGLKKTETGDSCHATQDGEKIWGQNLIDFFGKGIDGTSNDNSSSSSSNSIKSGHGRCGDNICEGPENRNNCSADCKR